MVQLLNDPCHKPHKGLKLKCLNNSTFVAANGSEVFIWSKNKQGTWGVS